MMMRQKNFPSIFGTATVNEKGQVVIPQEARQAFDIDAGSKLMVMGSPHGKGIILIKTEYIQAKLRGLLDALQEADNENKE
jgi:AbrB family looped-hinge helix DNA binding protein